MIQNDINEQDLDALLRGLYLEQQSQAADPAQADFVMTQAYPIVVDAKKERALLNRLQGKRGRLGGNTWLFMTLFLCLLTAGLLYYFKGSHAPVSGQPNSLREPGSSSPQEAIATSLCEDPVNATAMKVRDTFGRPVSAKIGHVTDSTLAKNRENTPIISAISIENTPYLAKGDELRYKALKKQMLRALLKSDKGLYTYVPENKFYYAGKSITMDAFTIRNMAITNLEYKTFLADLLVQKRNEDYVLASVRNEGWTGSKSPQLGAAYFTEEAYNDFPVVNVTTEGAKLFCKWLETEGNAYIREQHVKMKPLQARLPYDREWIGAAREGYAKIAFEKGYNTIYDLSEGLVDKSFISRAELVRKRARRVDTLYDLFTTNHYNWNEKEIDALFQGAFKYYQTVPADTIFAARMKVYGKIGRVSEIVCQENSTRTWLPGLSWKSKEEYLRLDSRFRSDGFSPFVGFRPVIIHAGDPEYKNPFW